MKFFMKKVEKKKPEETGVHPATLNWFIGALIDNVGSVKWVRMTKEEQSKYDKEHSHNVGYPYKVVQSPIPPGKNIVIKESGTIRINCDSEATRNLIIEMARAYDELEKKYHHSLHENAASEWHKVEELPPHSRCSSSHERGRIFLVSSPVLPYVTGGWTLGFRDGKKWYVLIDGKEIEHPVTHFRRLPPHPQNTNSYKYEDIREEAEKLRKTLGYGNKS